MVLIKKRKFFVQNVSVDTWIVVFSKLSKNCHKNFKQDLLETLIWEKTTNFRKQFFLKTYAPLDNWIAVLNILQKHFYHFSGINICTHPKRTWVFWYEFFALKFFFWRPWNFFLKFGRKLFARRSKKRSVIKLFFQNKSFSSKKSPSTKCEVLQLCWSFTQNLQSKSLKIRKR